MLLPPPPRQLGQPERWESAVPPWRRRESAAPDRERRARPLAVVVELSHASEHLGISCQQAPAPGEPVRIAAVADCSPAAEAGVPVGHPVLRLAGAAIREVGDVVRVRHRAAQAGLLRIEVVLGETGGAEQLTSESRFLQPPALTAPPPAPPPEPPLGPLPTSTVRAVAIRHQPPAEPRVVAAPPPDNTPEPGEVRVDVSDGEWYTRGEFEAHYGGLAEWEEAWAGADVAAVSRVSQFTEGAREADNGALADVAEMYRELSADDRRVVQQERRRRHAGFPPAFAVPLSAAGVTKGCGAGRPRVGPYRAGIR